MEAPLRFLPEAADTLRGRELASRIHSRALRPRAIFGVVDFAPKNEATMNKIVMAATMMGGMVLATAPVAAQEQASEAKADHAHECPHHAGAHEMGQHHEEMQGMASMHGKAGMHGDGHCRHTGGMSLMMMLHHPEMLDLTEDQARQLTELVEQAHEEAMPLMQQAHETMANAAEAANALLTAEQRERLSTMDQSMEGECAMMQPGDDHAGHAENSGATSSSEHH